jgi:peptidyl-prolyl cis-trans isomerase SurA
MKFLKITFVIFYVLLNESIAIENKIILKVENHIITSLDIFEEIKNLKFFNKNLNQIKNEEIYQIALQSILNQKIKEIEISKKFDEIKLDDENYLNFLIESKYKSLGYETLTEFKKELTNKKINFNNFKEKIKIDILWSQIIYSKYYSKIKINEKELRKEILSKKNISNSYELSEIVFNIENINEVNSKYQLIKEDIQKIGFDNAALKHSISTTASSGGNLGWIDEKQINSKLRNELNNTQVGNITKPIRIPGGFIILKKNDVKKTEVNLNIEQELKKLIDYNQETQLRNYSNVYFNKIKKDLKINAP